MKYVIHNVKDSCWNILGDKYFVIVTDPEISATMTAIDYKVREEGDPMPRDFIEKKAFQAGRYPRGEYSHEDTLKTIFEWISNDICERKAFESFEIKSHIYL